MSKIAMVHSFSRGVGKSCLAANMAALQAMAGKRIGLIDMNMPAPRLHLLFGLGEGQVNYTLNDYLLSKCRLEQTLHDVTSRLGAAAHGQLFLIPASDRISEVAQAMRVGYNFEILCQGLAQLDKDLDLDLLVIDAHAGLNQDIFVIFALTDILTIVLRPDKPDYQGAAVVLDVARQLEVPHTALILNKTPAHFNVVELKQQVMQTYGHSVMAVLPHSDEVMALAGSDIFCLRYPFHLFSKGIAEIAAAIMT